MTRRSAVSAEMDAARLGATELARRIRSGVLSPVKVLARLLERIERLDPAIKAWTSVDVEESHRTAALREAEARAGRIRGALHGVPVAIKDIYHVAGMVTTAGAGSFAHERPDADATAVAKLRAAGAVILGKTSTTEFAYRDPTDTRNPWSIDHSPGGSSSGSAASVAARMIPFALGSQTVGSTIKPAGYCGIVGFKATHGRISCSGIIPLAPSFDTVGIFSRHVKDAALGLSILGGFDVADLASVEIRARPVRTIVGTFPRLGLPSSFVQTATEEVQCHLEAVVGEARRAGAEVVQFAMPTLPGHLAAAGETVVKAEAAAFHAVRFRTHAEHYRKQLRAALTSGMAVRANDYIAALQCCRRFGQDVAVSMRGVDALLLPFAPAPAPKGLETTGDGTFCAPWSYAGLPAITLPSGIASEGLPLGIQLVGRPREDERLLRLALWFERLLAFHDEPAMLASER